MRPRSLLALTVALALVAAPHTPRALRLAPSGTITVLEPGAPDTLNPLLTRTAAGLDATAPVFDALVRLDASGTFQPDLAQQWHHSIDGRTWTFHLDPRARWQDGEPVTAGDVAFTARLVRDARFGAVSTRGFDHVTALTVGGSTVVTFTLSASYAPFLATVGTTPILPAHVLDGIAPARVGAYAPFNRHPIGSGPFTVGEFGSDGRVVEEANPDYFGGAPRLAQVVVAPAASRVSALTAARAGATVLPPSLGLASSEVQAFTGTVPARPLYSPSFAWTHLDLIEHGALANPSVRRALALATPRDAIIARVLQGHGRIADGDQAPGTPAYDPTLHNSNHYDITAARTLLRQAGLLPPPHPSRAQRERPRLTVNLWGDSACTTCVATLQMIAQGWAAAGVGTRLRLVPSGTLFGPRGPLYSPSRFQSPQYHAVLFTWVNGPDPDDSAYWMRNALVTAAHPLGGNFSGYANTTLDALATRALVTPNGPGRYALYRKIQRILTIDEPAIFLYWADAISVVPTALSGYMPNPYAPAATWNAGNWALTAR